jgi:hypothetical protein
VAATAAAIVAITLLVVVVIVGVDVVDVDVVDVDVTFVVVSRVVMACVVIGVVSIGGCCCKKIIFNFGIKMISLETKYMLLSLLLYFLFASRLKFKKIR